MLVGQELIKSLKEKIQHCNEDTEWCKKALESPDVNENYYLDRMQFNRYYIHEYQAKLNLLEEESGCIWFNEYATLEGEIVSARWCNTKYGYSLRAELPDGKVIWTAAQTAKGLAKKGLKAVQCLRPAWISARCAELSYFPSDVNFLTGKDAPVEPLLVRDVEVSDITIRDLED